MKNVKFLNADSAKILQGILKEIDEIKTVEDFNSKVLNSSWFCEQRNKICEFGYDLWLLANGTIYNKISQKLLELLDKVEVDERIYKFVACVSLNKMAVSFNIVIYARSEEEYLRITNLYGLESNQFCLVRAEPVTDIQEIEIAKAEIRDILGGEND